MDAIILDPEDAAREERQHVRFEGRVPCRIAAGEEVWTAWIRDLSIGGAGLEPAMPAILGREVWLTCSAFDFAGPVRGRVINVAHRRTCIGFDLTAELEAELTRFLEQNT